MKLLMPLILMMMLLFQLVSCGESDDDIQKEQDYPAGDEEYPRPRRELPPIGR